MVSCYTYRLGHIHCWGTFWGSQISRLLNCNRCPKIRQRQKRHSALSLAGRHVSDGRHCWWGILPGCSNPSDKYIHRITKDIVILRNQWERIKAKVFKQHGIKGRKPTQTSSRLDSSLLYRKIIVSTGARNLWFFFRYSSCICVQIPLLGS